MTAGRLYCIQSWNNASETSGEQIGNRLAQSRGLHFNRDGSANTFLYSEENNEKKPTKVPLKNRILPQAARVEKLRSEAIELETAFKAGEFSPAEYTLLREVAFKKLRRAEELLKRAVKPLNNNEDDLDLYDNPPEVEQVFYATNHASTSNHNSTWVDDLPNSNSLKLPLQKTLQVVRTLVRWHQAARNYINELKVI